MSDPNSTKPKVSSQETARSILGWQLSTYHHIQNLAKGLLTIVFTLLSILLTGLIYSLQYFPFIPTEHSEYIAVAKPYTFQSDIVAYIILINLFISLSIIFLSFQFLMKSTGMLVRLMVGARLDNGLLAEEGEEIYILPRNVEHSSVPIRDTVTPKLSNWIKENQGILRDANRDLKASAGRLFGSPIFILVGVYILLLITEFNLFTLVVSNSLIFISPYVVLIVQMSQDETAAEITDIYKPIEALSDDLSEPLELNTRALIYFILFLSILSVLIWTVSSLNI